MQSTDTVQAMHWASRQRTSYLHLVIDGSLPNHYTKAERWAAAEVIRYRTAKAIDLAVFADA